MKSIQEIKDSKGTWLFLIPIQGVRLGKAVNYELTVDRVTFVDAKKIANRRRRLGIPSTVSKIKSKYRGRLDGFFEKHGAFATLRLAGEGNELKGEFLNRVREELAILSLSQLGHSRRKHNSDPSIYYNARPESISCLMCNLTEDESYHSNETLGKIGPLDLDERWHNSQKGLFFYDLLSIISNRRRIAPNFRKDIINASILAGQSQSSIDIPQCFLWNMIALETLLTQRDDKYSDKLPERAEAFIGWAQDWQVENFSERIQNAYHKRCLFVHTGNREDISIEDILFTDDLLLNVIRNIVKHPNMFGSKKKIIEFSDKIQAAHLLGVESKVRPKTLRLIRPKYDEEDFKKI